MTSATEQTPIDVFVAYSSKDTALREQLEDHLSLLRREGAIRTWSHHCVTAGDDHQRAAGAHLDAATVILLLVSADFVASDYCYDVEMERALRRRAAGEAKVIPVLLRACDWSGAPFAGLAVLPANALPVTSWPSRDEAWTDVAQGIRGVVRALRGARVSEPPSQALVSRGTTTAERRAPTSPEYPDAETRALSEALEAARVRQRSLQANGFADEASAVRREILALRRRIREGGQLRAGDSLGDGRYLLVRKLGHGGFAVVWEAHDREAGEQVAIKVLHSQFAHDTLRLERFFRGARRMMELSHEAVVRILMPHGEDGGYHYFVMELVGGGDLHDAVLAGRIASETVLSAVLAVGRALAEAHARGLVHRDVKPANILLDAAGAAKLTDFDLVGAKDTTGGTRTGALGSLIYAAPEILDRPQDADARADVYSLAMTAIFGLQGAELSMEHFRDLDETLERLPGNDRLRAALKRAVDLDRDGRPADAGAFCEELEAALRAPPAIVLTLDALERAASQAAVAFDTHGRVPAGSPAHGDSIDLPSLAGEQGPAPGRHVPSRPLSIFATTRPQEGSATLGENLISEKSLDEVILSYLGLDEDPDGPRRE